MATEAPQTPGDVLRAARVHLQDKGWQQKGSGYGPNGELCLYMAISHGSAFASGEVADEAYRAVRHVIGWGIVSWNDAPGRTVEEVFAVLDRAIVSVS